MINTNAAFSLIQKGCDLAYEIAVNNPTVDALAKKFKTSDDDTWQQVNKNVGHAISEARIFQKDEVFGSFAVKYSLSLEAIKNYADLHIGKENDLSLKQRMFNVGLALPIIFFAVTHLRHCFSGESFSCQRSYSPDLGAVNAMGLAMAAMLIYQSYQILPYQEKINELKYKKMQQIILPQCGTFTIGSLAEKNLDEIKDISLKYDLENVNLSQVDQYSEKKIISHKETNPDIFAEVIEQMNKFTLDACIERRKFGKIAVSSQNTYSVLLKDLAVATGTFAVSALYVTLGAIDFHGESCKNVSESERMMAKIRCEDRPKAALLFGLGIMCIGTYLLVESISALTYKILYGEVKHSPTILTKKPTLRLSREELIA